MFAGILVDKKLDQHFEILVTVNKNRNCDLEIPVPVDKNRNQALNIRFQFLKTPIRSYPRLLTIKFFSMKVKLAWL